MSNNKKDSDLLQQFWGKKADLSDKDNFLRKYILEKGWIEKDGDFGKDTGVDKEDSEREDEIEGYEKKYNFRYEEDGAE